MQTGIVSETKHNKSRIAHVKRLIFDKSNYVGDILIHLQSGFFMVKLAPILMSNSIKYQ
jgi:hypothetical protein